MPKYIATIRIEVEAESFAHACDAIAHGIEEADIFDDWGYIMNEDGSFTQPEEQE